MLWISLLPILISTSVCHHFNIINQGLASVIPINRLHTGPHDPTTPWKADCNAGNSKHHKWIVAIWDDLNNFKDLDKIKCVGSEEGIWLDTNSSVVLDVQADTLDIRCPHNHIVTAIWDDKFGFPSVNKVKCTKIAYGRVHSVVSELVRTGSKSGGPYGERDTWNVECPEGWAIIGLNKDVHRTVSINCAPLQPQYGFL